MDFKRMILGGVLSVATLAFLLGAVVELGSVVSFGGTTANTVSGTVSVSSVCAISTVSNTAVNFGSLFPGNTISTQNGILLTDSGGNFASNILIGGGLGTSSPYNGIWLGTSVANQVGIANTVWAPSLNTVYGSATRVTNTLVDTRIVLTAPTIANPSTTNSIFLGMGVPSGTPPDTYTTNIVLETTC